MSLETLISIKLRCLYLVQHIKLWCLHLVQHMLHQIKAPQMFTNFLKLISFVMQSSNTEVEF